MQSIPTSELSLKYINEPSLSDFTCAICTEIIKGSVVVTECFHRFCDSCLSHHIQSSRNSICKCPCCRAEITQFNFSISENFTRKLDNEPVECSRIECKKHILRKDFYKHFYELCEFRKTSCENCKNMYYISKDHDCPLKIVPCPFCSARTSKYLLEEHYKNDCPKKKINCPNLYCTFIATRVLVYKHLESCHYRSKLCACGLSIPIYNMADHLTYCLESKISCVNCKELYKISETLKHTEVCPIVFNPCKYCGNMVKNENLNTHYDKCPQFIVNCYYCKKEFQRETLELHYEYCEYRMIKCKDCDEFYSFANSIKHNYSCEEKKIDCDFCKEKIKRNLMKNHLLTCDSVIIECKYKKEGCDVKLAKKHMADHIKDNALEHLRLVDILRERERNDREIDELIAGDLPLDRDIVREREIMDFFQERDEIVDSDLLNDDLLNDVLSDEDLSSTSTRTPTHDSWSGQLSEDF